MRLHKLTGLEHDKILGEYQNLLDLIEELMLILSSKQRLMEVIREELELILENFGRRQRFFVKFQSRAHEMTYVDGSVFEK